jgi:exonuclease III
MGRGCEESRPSDRAYERRDGGEIKVCTVNVGTMVGKGREVLDMLHRRKVYVCCVQEVRYKGSGATTVGGGEEKYKFWYIRNKDGRGGVGIFVRYGLVKDVVRVVRTSDQVIRIEMVFGGRVYGQYTEYSRYMHHKLAEERKR